MADNTLVVNGVTVRSSDRGAGVQAELTLDGNALTAAVLVAAIGTTATAPAFPGDNTTRRQCLLQNTGTTTVEWSPAANFAFGNGMRLNPGDAMPFNYSGAIYARVASGTGELRLYSEH